jgi:hypothetical protein
MNDRVGASMHSSGVQLELTALAWRRTSLSVLANATAHCAIGSPPKVMSGNATLRASRVAKSHQSGASHYVSAETRTAQIAAYHAKQP